MVELLTSAQMRATEQSAIDNGEVTGLELMERAGRGVIDAIFQEWPTMARTSYSAVVLCGPGNNGGDGFVIARLLKQWGWAVDVFLYGDANKLPSDARINYDRWADIGDVMPLNDADLGFEAGNMPDLIVDALFGTGLTRTVEAPLSLLLRELDTIRERYGVKCVSVDVPSGLCADSGRNLGTYCTVDMTVTFHSAKIGHYLERGSNQCGKLVITDIGLKPSDGSPVRLAEPEKGMMGKTSFAHKFSHGHAFVLSGPHTKTGAARLAAGGALRVGAGLVTIGAQPSAMAEHAAQLNAIMLSKVQGAEDYANTIALDERLNAICVGPAFGLSQDRADLLKAILVSKRATVLDADALTLISKDKALFDLVHENCVLTPHGGEFARVFPDIAKKLDVKVSKGPAYSKVDATRETAKRIGCVVLFKGADTVIAAPDGRCAINSAHYERSAPWLATAGSGDVLAGFITGLLARGFSPMQAAETGAWLHVECALKFGAGLIAEDIPEQLPKIFSDLGL
ncbi:NAD(P)H-hydrate dehydratase [Amylibacter sp. SFDW26]|uniref:NAD(P)H-hydrate dehydratase n=1 Tax=Amylibacter sp. SFDW26 TaxID=2652722 RepID=UPI0012622EDA|nr:NAD(P)H-hydrate dehydratase [Amylibacter sp. SFDW26]KAB7615710.1 NAD(P)H-hydrate dehydratase [Amylibacter sp. SFDW26]